MNLNQTISLKTKIAAIDIGYDNFPISQNVIPTGEHRKTCRTLMLHDWIYTNHNLLVEARYDENQKWGYIVWQVSTNRNKIYCASNFESEEDAFDEGLQRALYEIKCKLK